MRFGKKLTAAMVLAGAFFTTAQAQVSLPTAGSPVSIDFSSYAGGGFANPAPAGGLSSLDWAVNIEASSFDFGGTGLTGENPAFAVGIVNPGDEVQGVGAIDVAGKRIIWLRPTGSVLSPGTFTLRLQNNTGSALTGLDVTYDVYYYNYRDRDTLISFSHSSDNVVYTGISSANVLTPSTADVTPVLTLADGPSPSRTVNITGLNVSNGGFVYLRWTTNDGGSNSGQRDEHGFGNITVTPQTGGNIAPDLSNASVNTLQPTSGDALTFSINASDSDGTIAAVRLYTSNDNSTFTPTAMTEGTPGAYSLTIGPFTHGTPVYFYFEAEDNLGGTTRFPSPDAARVHVNDFRPAANQVVINEIQYTQVAPQPASTDWVEFHNTGSTAADLSFYTMIDDNPGNPPFVFPLGTVISPEGFVVIHQGSAFSSHAPWSAVPTAGFFDFGLGSGGDSVILRDDIGTEVDRVDYTASAPWPNEVGGAAGRSIELSNPSLPRNNGANWVWGPVDGTPGAANSSVSVGDWLLY